MEKDSSGYYWLHDDKDFYFYNGHQIVSTGLGKLLGKNKYEYFFSGDIIQIKGAFVFINKNNISLFDPLKKEVIPQWDLPDGDLFNHLYEDDLGDIWLFTHNPAQGTRPVYLADEELNFSYAFDLSTHLKDQGIFWDFELTDRNGLLFFHRRLGGLIILDKKGNEVQAPVQNLSDYQSKKECSQFRLDNQNNLWRIYNDNFEKLDWSTGQFKRHGLTERLEFITDCKKEIEVTNLKRGLEGFGSLLNLRSIYTDSKNRIWMSCAAAYLVMYDPSNDNITGFRTPIVKELEGGDYDVKFIFEDDEGNIWGNQKGGLFKIRDKEPYFSSYVVNTSDENHPVYKIEDQKTIRQSIDHYNDYAIRNSAVHGIGEDKNDNVIFQEGVFTYQLNLLTEELSVLPLFNPKEKVHLTVEEDLMVYASWDSYYKVDDNFNVQKIKYPANKIENIFKQRNGNIWLSGILNQHEYMFGQVNPDDFEYQGNYKDKEGLANFNLLQVRDIEEDDKGMLWIATANGIYRLDTGTKELTKWTDSYALDQSNHTIGPGISQLIHHKESLFWFKSDYDFGLVDLNENRIKYLRKIDDEISGTQLKILPADDHTLWIGDKRGIAFIDFTDDNDIILSHEEGIDTRGEVKVMRKLKTGIIAIGTNNGFYTFNPEYILSKAKIRESKDLNVPLLVNAYSYLDAPSNERYHKQFLSESNLHITLDHDHRDLQVDVSIKDFDYPSRHSYSYKLEGFDNDWSPETNENVIGYSSIPPGDYKLLVQGSVSGGVWSNQSLAVSISVHDVWYRAWWFVLLMLSSISAIVYFATNYYQGLKLQRQLAIAKVRDRISKDLHDDVGTMLASVAIQSELLENFVDEKTKPLAKKISNKSREAMGRMRDTVWAIDSRKDGIGNLKDRMMDYLYETIPEDRLEYSFEDQVYNKDLDLPPDIRQATYLIFKESISNIVKHSDTTSIDILLSTNKDQLKLQIKDQGSPKNRIKTSGQGLINMKSRATNLNGTYVFDYDDGYQTTVVLPLLLGDK